MVNVIRSKGAQQLINVGGIEYPRDLSWVLVVRIEGENIAYAAHIYLAHSRYSWDRWLRHFLRDIFMLRVLALI
jgi:hypothetical protein